MTRLEALGPKAARRQRTEPLKFEILQVSQHLDGTHQPEDQHDQKNEA
jgi:hypothetical protein